MSLYRKYRPAEFSEVIGQKHITTTLQNAIAGDNISHAYLFYGGRGSGKTTLARIFAKAVNCSKRKGFEPCGECASCLDIAKGSAIDLMEIDAASNRGIDDIRALREGVKFSPTLGKYRVYIIDECHQLSKDASNALLKTLEEPPAHAIFILATTEAHKMLPTIVSRCQRFDFKKLNLPEIVEKLRFIAKQEKIDFDEKALALIALAGRGSFRDAESLLETCINFSGKDAKVTLEETKEVLGVVEVGQIAAFVSSVIAKDAKAAILHLNQLADNSTDLQEFTKTLVYYLHQALLLKLDSSSVTAENSAFSAEELNQLQAHAAKLESSQIARMLELFTAAESAMKYANIPQLPLELAVVSLSGYGS